MADDAECVDDPAIGDAEVLWRYVHPTQLTRDKQSGRIRPASGAFIDKAGRMSVDLASMTSTESAHARNPRKFIAQFTAGTVRAFSKKVTQAIDRDPANPAHAVVCPKLTASEARVLAGRNDIWGEPPPEGAVPPLAT